MKKALIVTGSVLVAGFILLSLWRRTVVPSLSWFRLPGKMDGIPVRYETYTAPPLPGSWKVGDTVTVRGMWSGYNMLNEGFTCHNTPFQIPDTTWQYGSIVWAKDTDWSFLHTYSIQLQAPKKLPLEMPTCNSVVEAQVRILKASPDNTVYHGELLTMRTVYPGKAVKDVVDTIDRMKPGIHTFVNAHLWTLFVFEEFRVIPYNFSYEPTTNAIVRKYTVAAGSCYGKYNLLSLVVRKGIENPANDSVNMTFHKIQGNCGPY